MNQAQAQITPIFNQEELVKLATEMKITAANDKSDFRFKPSDTEEKAIKEALDCEIQDNIKKKLDEPYSTMRVIIMDRVAIVASLTVDMHPTEDCHAWHLSISRIAKQIPGEMVPPEKVPEEQATKIREAFFPDGVDIDEFAPTGLTNIRHYYKKYVGS